MIKKPILVFQFMLLLSPLCFSQGNSQQSDGETQTEASDERGANGFWEANTRGGNYVVALGRISSVSRHEYVLDGTLIVDEVTIDTVGQALARFYFIKPITSGASGSSASGLADRAMELADGLAQKTGSNVQNMVVKKYPLTTHAKSIEYRLLTEAQLDVLFQSVKTAWQKAEGRVFNAP
jgi:hypothetical protein